MGGRGGSVGGVVCRAVWGAVFISCVSNPFTEVFNMLLCGMFNPLPANFHYCAIDRNDEIINSNLTGTRERLCAQRFLVLERIRKLP